MDVASTLQTCFFAPPRGPTAQVHGRFPMPTDRQIAVGVTIACGQLRDVERLIVTSRLELMGGHRARTAASLGIGLRTLGMKLKAWGVPRETGR